MDKNESLSEEGEQIQASRRPRLPPKTRVKVNKKIYKAYLRKNNGVSLSYLSFRNNAQNLIPLFQLVRVIMEGVHSQKTKIHLLLLVNFTMKLLVFKLHNLIIFFKI